MRGPAGGVRAAEPHSPQGAGGGRAPVGLELRPWEGNPHSPPAPGRGVGEEETSTSSLPPQARGSRLAPRGLAPRRACGRPGFLSPPIPVPADGRAAADQAQPSPRVVRDLV